MAQKIRTSGESSNATAEPVQASKKNQRTTVANQRRTARQKLRINCSAQRFKK
jgi:hypothetical protein